MVVIVEVVSAPGCVKCGAAKELVKKIIKDYKGAKFREIDVVEHPDVAVKHGIFSTPAILVDGKLEFSGMPSEKDLRSKIESRMNVKK